MRATLIFFGLAVATLIFVMLLRPGSEAPDQPRTFEPRERSAEQPALVGADRNLDAGREDRKQGADSRGETTIELEPESESERPDGGYDGFGQRFHATDDYHAFVEEAMEAAQNGDPAAQYYLYRALSECGLAVNQFDGEFPDEQTLAGAVPRDMNAGVSDLMMDQVRRCEGFFEDDIANYGHAEGWLDEAAAEGYGPAVMHQGIRDYQRWQAGRDTDFNPANIVETLRQRNPETLSYASQLSALSGASEVDETAWLLLACDYGQDCSGDADWVQALCLQQGCPASFDTAEDALSMMLSPGEMEQARERVQALEQALDEGDFDSLFP